MSTLDPTSALDGTALLNLDVDVNAALDIAAPVDAAVAANANAALPIDAAVSANVLAALLLPGKRSSDRARWAAALTGLRPGRAAGCVTRCRRDQAMRVRASDTGAHDGRARDIGCPPSIS